MKTKTTPTPSGKQWLMIGIDPDIDKSGVAFWNRKNHRLDLTTMAFFELFENLKATPDKANILVFIEAGWLNKKSNFRKGYVKNGQFVEHSKRMGENIANKVGRNAETGRKIEEMCIHLGIPYQLVKPRKAKVSAEMFTKLTGLSTRNQEEIDAAMLVYQR